ncbi:MAG TPA: multicopper oxidase family protein [Xanthobacteraceae bacterium]|nr:multicopper oxidase family protein [Xanthobacteraceae bacterium]
MDRPLNFSRRRFLRYSTLGSLALLTPPGALRLGAGREARANTANAPTPDVELALSAQTGEVSLLPGRATHIWKYTGKVLKGPRDSLAEPSDTYLGPVIRVRRGQRVRLRLQNDLAEATNIHWHGLHVPADMDGHPRHVAPAGREFIYEFDIKDRAGTYWYHPHPHGRTGKQIYSGLAGLFLIEDDEEQALELPRGEYDVPLVLQDRTFDADNQLVYLDDNPDRDGGTMRRMMDGGMGGMMQRMLGGVTMNGMMDRMMGGGMRRGGGMMGMMARMMGFLGDRVVVNGRPDFTLTVATRAYRLRLLNASNSRIFKLAWQDGSPLTVIATDGGLLEKPLTKPYVTLAPGERIELWADFSRYPVGTELRLRSLPFAGGMAMSGMMMGMMRRGALENGAEFDVLKVRVHRKERRSPPLPARLSAIERYRPEDAVNFNRPRRFHITMGHMRWGINGRRFEMEGVADDEVVKLDTLEIWEFANDASMGMMGMMAHPMHIHGLQFQVIERTVMPALTEAWKTVSAGYVDDGWKDEVLLMPGERAKVLLRFKNYTGLFAYHCHMLEHGDTGLMRNYRVRA